MTGVIGIDWCSALLIIIPERYGASIVSGRLPSQVRDLGADHVN